MAAPGAPVQVPVAVARAAAGFSKQAYYKWLKKPVSDREVEEAHLIKVLHELQEGDPEGGYRVLAHDMTDLGYEISERRVWRLCRVAGIRSTITTRKRKNTPPGPPAHDELIERKFRSDAPNRLWLMDLRRAPHQGGEAALVRGQGRLQ